MKKTIHAVLITTLSAAMFAMPVANAGTYNPIIGNNQTMPMAAFKEFLKITSDNRVAKTFGFPDEIISAKDANDKLQGVVWVYKDLVASDKGALDARFLIVNGNVQMYSLANNHS
jgi:hypothetical protein